MEAEKTRQVTKRPPPYVGGYHVVTFHNGCGGFGMTAPGGLAYKGGKLLANG
jgi:hypothetical protein